MKRTGCMAVIAGLTLLGCGDDGGNDNHTADASIPMVCGNGSVEGAEECDDGAQNSDTTANACRTNCTAARCGDGVVDSSESCDDGAQNSATEPDACRPGCELPTCGDGVMDPGHGETCDDGNNTAGDGCGATCLNENCGDGQLDPWEACDDGNTESGDGCSSDCRSDETCGNGIVDSVAGETCDDGNTTPDDGCSADCTSTELCGNGAVDVLKGEECDDGVQNSDTAPDACRTDCTLPYCGDGITDSVEGCDEASGNSDLPNASCRTDCTPQRCGDGIRDQGEPCDGADLGGTTCADLGYTVGSLQCDASCGFTGCTCLDLDLDGYGAGCAAGPDCDDGAGGITTCEANGCPAGWMLIPAGSFEMGCNAGELDGTCAGAEQPRHTVTLSAYCMEPTEVSVAGYRACVDAGVCHGTPETTSTNDSCNWSASVGSREQLPINCINWAEAREYCQSWLGGDLPSEAQWEKAARGGPGDTRKYPWGDTPEPDCTRANAAYGGYCYASEPHTWEVGHVTSAAGDSPYGLKDLAGNVREWVQDFYDAAVYAQCSGGCTDPLNTTAATWRAHRGGSWDKTPLHLRVVWRGGTEPTNREARLGFRCRRIP